MKAYNIYYNHKRINNTLLSKDDIDEIKSHKTLRKFNKKINIHNADSNNVNSNNCLSLEEIPVNDIRIVECIIF